MFSLCPVRGGILCKLWKAITDYRQKPTWGLKWRQPLREVWTFVPTAQYSPLYLSIYKSKTFRRRTCVRRVRRAAFNPHKKLFDWSCQSILVILKKGSLWKQQFLRSATRSAMPDGHHAAFCYRCVRDDSLVDKSIVKILKTFSPVFTRCNVYRTGDWPFSNTSLRYKILHSKSSVLMFLSKASYHYFI